MHVKCSTYTLFSELSLYFASLPFSVLPYCHSQWDFLPFLGCGMLSSSGLRWQCNVPIKYTRKFLTSKYINFMDKVDIVPHRLCRLSSRWFGCRRASLLIVDNVVAVVFLYSLFCFMLPKSPCLVLYTLPYIVMVQLLWNRNRNWNRNKSTDVLTHTHAYTNA